MDSEINIRSVYNAVIYRPLYCFASLLRIRKLSRKYNDHLQIEEEKNNNFKIVNVGRIVLIFNIWIKAEDDKLLFSTFWIGIKILLFF